MGMRACVHYGSSLAGVSPPDNRGKPLSDWAAAEWCWRNQTFAGSVNLDKTVGGNAMSVPCARRFPALLLAAGLVLTLASGLAACGGAADDALPSTEAPPTPAAIPEPPAAPGEATAPDASTSTATPAETAPTPRVTPDPQVPAPEPPAVPAEPPAPAASPQPAASGEPSLPTAESPAPEPAPLTFLYDTYDLSGAVAEPGHYAFLADPADPASVVTTYEELRDGSTTALLIHTTDADSMSRTDFYDDVEAGDVVEWREASDCFVRYPVTEVKDDPTGDPPRKLLGVRVMTYAFTGCSGAIDTTESPTITWSPANLQSPEMTVPIRHGPWQLIPHGWTGSREDTVLVQTTFFPESADLAMVRQHRLWREPTLPAGWRLLEAYAGIDGMDGVTLSYGNAAGGSVLDIGIRQLSLVGRTRRSTTADHQDLIVETRIIDGHPAVVEYSPTNDRTYSTRVSIFDETTNIKYFGAGFDLSLRGGNIDDLIAIVRSLYRTAP